MSQIYTSSRNSQGERPANRKTELGFYPEYKVEDAIHDIVIALKGNRFVNPLDNSLYFNIKRMNTLELS